MVDINAIYGVNPNSIPQPVDPVHVFQGWQNLSNSMLQNKLGQAQLTGTNIANQQAGQNLKTQQSNRVAQQTFGLLTLPDDQLKNATLQTLRQELSTGTIDQNTYSTWLSNLPSADAPVGQWRAAITAHLIGTMSGPEAVSTMIGTPSSINTGQSVQTGLVGGPLSRQPGAFTPSGSPVDVYPTRSELAGQVTQLDSRMYLPDGSPNPTYGQQVTVPMGTRLQQQGSTLGGPAGGAQPQPQPGVGPARAVPAPVPQGDSATPPAPGSNPQYDALIGRLNGGATAQPSASPANANPAAPPGSVVTGFAPGTEDSMKASAAQFSNDRAMAGQFATRTFPLVQAIALYKAGVETGPATDLTNEIRSFLVAHDLVNKDKIQVADFDALRKYLTQYTNNQPMAAGSDARLSSAITGNPSTHISTMAGQDVAKALLGIERMKQAALLDYNGSPAGYADFLKSYSTHVDPRAFIVDLLDKDARTKMVNGMSPSERTNFYQSLQVAKRHDLLTTTPLPTAGQ